MVMDEVPPPELAPLIPHFRSLGHGFDIQRGWWPLVRACHDELVAVFPAYELLAVKQKWAVLTVQAFPRPGTTWTEDEYSLVQQITDRYAEESATICEYCGAAGRLREDRSLEETLCDTCDDSPAADSASGGL